MAWNEREMGGGEGVYDLRRRIHETENKDMDTLAPGGLAS